MIVLHFLDFLNRRLLLLMGFEWVMIFIKPFRMLFIIVAD